MKKKMPAILDPDADDFCYLIARALMRLLDNGSHQSDNSEDDTDRDLITDSSDKPIPE